jgi:BioD-like phosphotransacetylase family protein
MNAKDLKLAKAKVTYFLDLQEKSEVNREVTQELLTSILSGLKEETWENAVRIALIKSIQKDCGEENASLPVELINFLSDGTE